MADRTLERVRRRPVVAPERASGAHPTTRARTRYRIVVVSLVVLSLAIAVGILAWGNPMPVGSAGFWKIVELRGTSLIVMLVVALCQGVATVAFQTAAGNRIITPSIMGFEALYVAVQTSAVYVMGAAGILMLTGVPQFLAQVTLMVGFALALYGWLLRGRRASIHSMLLVGIVIGGGLGSVSTFMQRLLSPSEFDVLSARLFGSIGNAEPAYLPIAVPLAIVAAAALWMRGARLDAIALGREVSTAIGVDHGREVRIVLTLVAVLIATSTALVGPMVFLGFLVAMLSYQLADTYEHRRILPVAALVGFVVLAGASFVLKHIFYAEGVVSIIIELVGGSAFLLVILKKSRL